MRAIVVYESIFGNTRLVAEAIGEGLRRAGVDAAVAEVNHAPAPDGADLVVVGGPIHAWGMTRPGTRRGAVDEARRAHVAPVSDGIGVREWLARLPTTPAPRAAAAFDTAVDTRWFPTGSAAKGEARELRRAGYRLVAAPEHFLVEDTQGPLVAGEVERAAAWGARLAELPPTP